jgi:hypothetical protein
LDLAAQEVTAAAKGEKHAGKAPKERMEALTNMAREGAEKYIETQKKLLELAIDQLEEATKTARVHKEPAHKEPQHTWGELTEKSVKNLVTAEKSLLELAMKPMKGHGREDGRKGRRKNVKKTPAEAREPVATPA